MSFEWRHIQPQMTLKTSPRPLSPLCCPSPAPLLLWGAHSLLLPSASLFLLQPSLYIVLRKHVKSREVCYSFMMMECKGQWMRLRAVLL